MKKRFLIIPFILICLCIPAISLFAQIDAIQTNKGEIDSSRSLRKELTDLGKELVDYLIDLQEKSVSIEDMDELTYYYILYGDMLVLEANNRGLVTASMIESKHEQENQISNNANQILIKYIQSIIEKIDERIIKYPAFKEKGKATLILGIIESNSKYYNRMKEILERFQIVLSYNNSASPTPK